MTYRPAEKLPFTAFGDMRVAEPSPILNGSFEYTVDNTALNTNTVVSTGTVTQADAMALVSSGATAASTALLQSLQHTRVRPGQGALLRFTARFDTPIADGEQLIGFADEVGTSEAFENGYMLGYVGTVFGFHRYQNDVLFSTPIADWDDPLDGSGDSGMTLDPTKINVFFIQVEYLGGGPMVIYVQPGAAAEALPFIAHVEPYSNANLTPSVFNPSFHHTMWVNNGAVASDVTLRSASYSYFVEGHTERINIHEPVFASGLQEKLTVTTEVAIFTIRNKSTYVSKVNFIDVVLESISASIEASSANNLGQLRCVKNATLGGVPSWADINTSDSVIELDVAGTTVTGGVEVAAEALAGKNDKSSSPIGRLELILNPGDTMTVAGSSANSATMDAGIVWRELF